ncbi:HORMA domain-containing protein [Aspergillus nidulans var. acristatus]
MVRIKFTGPPTAVRPQHAQARPDLPPDNITPASSPPVEPQTAAGALANLSPEDGLVMQQQQSLEMVKIMLHVSIGTLFYLREFLPLQCFDDRDLKTAQRQQKFSYREFIDNDFNTSDSNGVANGTFGTGKRGQPLKIIVRNSEPKADMIINVLETGIFDALSKSVLEAIQLTIIADKEAPENVLESYTFSFRYSEKLGDLSKRLESLSIQPCGYVANMKSAYTARVGLESIVRRLITLSSFLPTLPNKRALGVHLFYTEDCPPDYEPPGFSGAKDDIIKYPLTEHWIRESQACGRMESGWHTVGLKVTSLKWIGPEPEESESIPQIPAQIEYTDAVTRGEDIGIEDEERKLPSSQSEVGNSQEATQDVVERERLQSMMPSQEVQSSNMDLTSTQPVKPLLTTGNEDTETIGSIEKFVLREGKIAELRKTSKAQKVNGQDPFAVRCQCDWKGQEEDMIMCSFCHTRQHRLCYGYVDAYKFGVSDVHACYRCLLEPSESKILESLNNVVLARRALTLISDEGIPSSNMTFGEKIHCNDKAVARLKEFLKRKGIFHSPPGSTPKESVRRGLPPYCIPDKESVRKTIKQDIMHPMAKIQHHYTTQYVPQTMEALNAPSISGADGLGKLSSQMNVIPERSNKADEQRANDPRDRSIDSPHQASSSQRRTRSSNTQALLTPQPVKDTPGPTRKRTRSSQIGPEPRPVTPSQSTTTDPERENEGHRRSGRQKRRKVSNYSKLIDVGAETSGNE